MHVCNKAATAMDSIVQMIQDIAGQITLLSLNATIEAARAGEAEGLPLWRARLKHLQHKPSKRQTRF